MVMLLGTRSPSSTICAIRLANGRANLLRRSPVVGSLYGWKRKNGLRRFCTAYVEVVRKNSVFLVGKAFF
jgi:hypothetical protein